MGLTPEFEILAEHHNITDKIRKRLISIQLVDYPGMQSDTLEIRLDDKNHELMLPRTGTQLRFSLGYQETAAERMGSYIVDEIELSGPPDILIIRAKSIDIQEGLKEPKTRTWQNTGKRPQRILLKEILESIATEYNLKAKISEDFKTMSYTVVNQTSEHDLNLITRLADKVGAVAKLTNGCLLFTKKGETRTVSGKFMPPISLRPKEVTQWHVSLINQGAYASVKARYRDTSQSKEIEVKTGEEKPVYSIRKMFKDKTEASEAAKAQLDKFKRNKATINIQLPGTPLLMAESSVHLSRFREGVNGYWIVENAMHILNNSGYSTSIKASLKRLV